MRIYEDDKPVPNLEEWHRWFAWHPCKAEMADGRNALIVLEPVERKGVYGYGGWTWRYREPV